MQAVRLARQTRISTAALRRTLATHTQPMPSAAADEEPHLSTANAKRARQTRAASDVPLGNIEAQWDRLSADEQAAVYGRLEELQKRDWKTLSVGEKKAGASPRPRRAHASVYADAAHRVAWYVSFGPHGPRSPVNPPGTTAKIIGGMTGLVALSAVIFLSVRAMGTSSSFSTRVVPR
jgi:hypothetical protein